MSGEPEYAHEELRPSSSALPAVTVYNLPPDPDDPECDELWNRLAEHFLVDTPDKRTGPFRRVLHVARLGGCRTVVVEERYLDPDYRSEFAAFWSKRFEERESRAKRLHFFADELGADDLHDLKGDHGYLGYSVFRPTPLGPVGRTVLKRPPKLDGAFLTQVHDRPSLFGNRLDIVGVPFQQQDGELLICAHTAAWLCHYVAQDRGIIGRHTTADIVAMPSVEGSRHRPVPSTGLTSEQLQGVFSTLNIPAFFYDVEDLPEPPSQVPRREHEEDGTYQAEVLREQILQVVCKYINSGFPVVVLTENGAAHAFTIVGWQKTADRIRLIACDDQYGPYEVIDDPLAKPEHRAGQWKSLMLPLPEKVFLTGEAAEIAARGTVLLTAAEYQELDDPEVDDPQANDMSRVGANLQELRGPVSVRARLVEGRRYKEMLQKQERSSAPLRLLRLAHLPHWVWLIEFHDRAARDDHKVPGPCVLAEFVYDSTSHDDNPMVDLLSTTSLAADVGLSRQGEPDDIATAEGDGAPWRSLISDPQLVDEEFLGGSGEYTGAREGAGLTASPRRR